MWNAILSKNTHTHTRCHNRWKMVTLFLMGFDTSNLFVLGFVERKSYGQHMPRCFFFGAIQSRKYNPNITPPVPSGKRLHNYGKINHFSWVNLLFLWPFSIAFSVSLPGRVINIYIYIYIYTHAYIHFIHSHTKSAVRRLGSLPAHPRH